MGQIRYQLNGAREVMVVSFSSLRDYAGAINMAVKTGQDFFDYWEKIMMAIDSKEALDSFKSQGGVLYHHIMKAGQLMVLPQGSFVFERSLGDQNVIGIRVAYINAAGPHRDIFSSLVAMHEAHVGTESADTLAQFWKSTLDLFPKAIS